MSILPPSKNSLSAAAKLQQAWRFLSGEIKEFELATDQAVPPPYAEFCFFIAFTLGARDAPCGIGVLINRPSALRVAAHMFGTDQSTLSDDDLEDASAEVCNVFSESVARYFRNTDKVSIGLPHRVQAPSYDEICQNSTVFQVFQSGHGSLAPKVVIFDPLHLPA